jgi:N-acetylglucosamine-6-sulfatase
MQFSVVACLVFTALVSDSVNCGSLVRNVDIDGTTDPEPQPGDSYLVKHQAFLDKIMSSHGQIPIVFWGDSLTSGWSGSGNKVFQAKYAPLGVANFGIGSDKTQNLLWRLINGEANPILTTKVAVMMIGGNNGKEFGITTEKIFRGIEANVLTIRQNMPNTKILLLAMIPGLDNLVVGTLIKDVNRKVATLHNGDTIQVLDMYDKFLNEDGTINGSLYNEDKIHLVGPGYELWSETMDPLLHQMLK